MNCLLMWGERKGTEKGTVYGEAEADVVSAAVALPCSTL